MPVSVKDVLHVALLAKMSFTEEEAGRLVRELNSVLEYVDMISGLDIASVPPTSYVHEPTLHLRKDEPGQSLGQKEAIGQAPDSGRGCFKVPRVV